MSDMNIKTNIQMNTTPPSQPQGAADTNPDPHGSVGASGGSSSADIIETTPQTFMADVIEASRQKLVLVEFGADWCEPCKQLEPVLEKIVSEAGGQLRLVKMDVEKYPQIAQQLQVQSIPAVFAFRNGQPRDGFMGVLPEGEIKKFISKNLGAELEASPVEAMTQAGEAALAAREYEQALGCFNAALQAQADYVPALAGLAQAYIATGATEQAEQILARVPADAADNPALAAAQAALALAHKAGTLGDQAALQAQVDADPNNHQARFDLALALHAAGERVGAIEALLEIIARERNWEEEKARKQLLELFAAYGAEDECVVEGRRRLSSLLFS